MLRVECLKSIYSELENCLVVTIMGAVAAELQSLGHRPNFFYLQHAMGLAKKLVHVVFDNESLLSVGGFPTATSAGTDLEGISRASGIPRVATVRSVENFKATVTNAMHGSELTTIIAKVEAKGPAAYVTDLSLVENRFQFRRHIQSLKDR